MVLLSLAFGLMSFGKPVHILLHFTGQGDKINAVMKKKN